MCTSITYQTKNTYFGRNLDLEYNHDETITITPRNFPFHFRATKTLKSHYAIIGVAYVVPDEKGNDYPLYYDAINEKGLGVAGLNFVGNARFFKKQHGVDNITPFELIPWLLGQASTVAEAKKLLSHLSLLDTPFSPALPLAELHWLIADRNSSITVESTAAGLQVYDNPVGVLTNNPPFPAQLFQLNNFMQLSSTDPKNTFAPDLSLSYYSRGLGTHGLPGGLDSGSRFVKATFTKLHATSPSDELSSVSQFFHILHSAGQQRGCAQIRPREFEITIYSTCYNLDQGLAYYTCYDNHQISSVNMHHTDLDAQTLTSYPMLATEHINAQN